MAGPPFNINNTSPAPNALINAFPADEQANRTLIEDWLSWISDPTTGMIRSSVLPAAASVIPSGTKMLFVQTAAPTGFTKDVTHNNKALRIVNGTAGTGGSTAFTTVFASRTPAGSIDTVVATGSISSVSVTGTTDATTQSGTIGNTTDTGTVGGTAITVANLPAHDHGAGTYAFSDTTSSDGSHTHGIHNGNAVIGAGGAGTTSVSAVSDNDGSSSNIADAAGAHTHTVSGPVTGTSGSTGSGTTHTHSLTMNAHNHTFTGNSHTHTFTSNTHNHTFTGTGHGHTFTGTAMDFAVQYVDVIIATKD